LNEPDLFRQFFGPAGLELADGAAWGASTTGGGSSLTSGFGGFRRRCGDENNLFLNGSGLGGSTTGGAANLAASSG